MNKITGRKAVGVFGALAIACSVVLAWAAPPASADTFHNSTMKAATNVRACTNTADASCAPWTTISGTVAMRCWRDESGIRWFWVDGAGKQGFVPATSVANQWLSSPYCDNTPSRYRAVRWAGLQLKQTVYTRPNGQAQDSRGFCLGFVADAWTVGGRNIGSRSRAIDFWNSPPSGTKVATSSVNAPVGALVFWRGTSQFPEGHVAISIGDGYAISTLERTTTTIHVLNLAQRNAELPGRYLGWIQY
jgi:cell wall-associated NlpC family hydrolase